MSRAADRAYATIRARIVAGEVEPGAPLREEQLAEECGVSRTPVRDALRRLEAELFVVRSDSQRSFVADWSSEDVGELFALRGMMEAHAAARAATRMSDPALRELRTINATIADAVAGDTPDIAAFLDGNRRFHRLVVEAAQSPRLAVALGLFVEQPVVRRTAMRYGRDHLAQSAREHDELVLAFAATDAGWAAAVMTAHIRRAYHVFSATGRATPDS